MTLKTNSYSTAEDAHTLLQEMERHLGPKIPKQREISLWSEQRKDRNAHAEYEGAFLDKYVLSEIYSFLQTLSFTEDQMRSAVFPESVFCQKAWKCRSPIGQNKYPFSKKFGVASQLLANTWWDCDRKTVVAQSCPDLALQEPFPKIVFEAKLFRNGGVEAAKTQLVEAIYQCQFYRGHPYVAAIDKYAKWDYDFACLMAFDASEGQSMVKAWKSVRTDVHKACWDSSRVFVMVFPSGGR